MIKGLRIITLCSIILFTLVACSIPGLSGKAPEKLGIRGKITKVTSNNGSVTIFVEGSKESDTEYDKASVKVEERTTVLNSEKKKAKPEDLKEGYTVEVVFSGAVLESYPVQGTAKKVVVIKEN